MADKQGKSNRTIPIDQLRSMAQPPSTLSRRNAEHWLSGVYGRRVSIYFTWMAVRLGISADTGRLASNSGAAHKGICEFANQVSQEGSCQNSGGIAKDFIIRNLYL